MGLGDKMKATRENAHARLEELQAKQAELQRQTALNAFGHFGKVSFRSGVAKMPEGEFPLADCVARVEQGADVRTRGWTLTTGMIGSGKLKGHMFLVIETPGDEHRGMFQAKEAEHAEKFAARFNSSARAWKQES